MSSVNYQQLLRLVPQLLSLEEGVGLKSQAEGFMDLNLDVIHKDEQAIIIALSHYTPHPCGELMANPDMELRISKTSKTVETLTYQDSFGYQKVWVDKTHYCPKLKKQLNAFLGRWLESCLLQGHSL